MKSWVLHLSLFLAGMTFIVVNLHDVEPLPFWSWSRNKVNWVQVHGEEYDTMFFGSSRMHYGLRPDVFDARMAELGTPTKSFNFALSGLRMHDVAHMLDWVVAHKPSSLKRAVIELHSFEQSIRGDQWFSDQDLEMHSPDVFWTRMQSVAISNTPVIDKAKQAQYVLMHSASNALRLGQGGRITQDWLAKANGGRLPKAYDVADRGWQSVASVQLPHMVKEHEEFPSMREHFERQLSWKALKAPKPLLDGGFNAAAIRRQASMLRAAGIEPIYVVMPTYSTDFYGRDGVADIAKEVRVLELDDPAPNRPLYDWAGYYDASHLNAEGAAAFSRYLAERIVEVEPLPLGASPSPHLAPAIAPTLAAAWSADGQQLQLSADGLPFVGDVVVQFGDASAQAVDGGLALAVAQPPKAVVPLVRELLYRAAGSVPVANVPAGEAIKLQLVTTFEGKVLAVSAPIKLAPR
jgi:hypothetical protein